MMSAVNEKHNLEGAMISVLKARHQLLCKEPMDMEIYKTKQTSKEEAAENKEAETECMNEAWIISLGHIL